MSTERDLLEQEWEGTQTLADGVVIEKHLRWIGGEPRVIIEAGEDEDTKTVFYGPPERATKFVREVEDDIDQEDSAFGIREAAVSAFYFGAQLVQRYDALGLGDTEAGYQKVHAARREAGVEA
jgi:hypothetical protein